MDKTFDAAAAEARIAAMWEKDQCFAAGANARPGAESFCIVIPPPNVTGSLHMGHALNNTLQDILIRWKRMQGYDTLWQPGQDHAGIATQMVVERKLAESGEPGRREMGRAAFLDRVWAWKEESGGVIIDQLKRLGASCDWSRNRFTMDEGLSQAVRKIFVQLYRDGLIYRGKHLVNWDPRFETAISDLEVENIDVDGHMWHFKYPLVDGATYEHIEKDEDGEIVLRETRDYISIATTRPETMLGDGAVAVHPSDARYAPIVGKLCEIPVGPKAQRRRIPIITDEYPDPTFGSGAVKITGAHDFNDYGVAKRNGIPCYRLMDGSAAMRDDGAPYVEEAAKAQSIIDGAEYSVDEIDAINLVPESYRGLDRFEARKRVVADITAEGLAVVVTDAEGVETPYVESKKITQPFGDRSKVVIEPMLTDQWFVDAKTLAEPAIAAVRSGETRFAPETWEKTYFQWLENIEPWCVSRQLWWGHRIPVWYGPDGTHFCEETEAEAYAAAERHYGRSVDLVQDEDVLDTWFSSALWPFSTLGWPEKTPELQRYYKTDVLITGFDIIFFWVARMMMSGLHVMKDADGRPEVPFHTVYVHALVRDEKGKKMSKSLGNVIDPLDLIDQYGADAVRFTLTSMAAMGRDIRLSVDRVAGYRNFGTKLWNAVRFAQLNGCARAADFDPVRVEQPLNKWIVGETARLREAVDAALASYRFNDYASALYAHTWGVFCDWYLEFAKPLLQGDDPAAKSETQATTAWALDQILLMMHPVQPFLTEELWAATAGAGGRAKPLVHGDWPTHAAADLADADADADIDWVKTLIEEVRSIRATLNVPAGAKAPLTLVGADAAAEARMGAAEDLVLRMARLETWTLADTAPKGSVTIPLSGAVACLDVADLIDVAAETARLTKARDKLDKEMKGLSAKLGNDAFLAKAPPEIVEEQKERLAAATDDRDRLSAALERLRDVA